MMYIFEFYLLNVYLLYVMLGYFFFFRKIICNLYSCHSNINIFKNILLIMHNTF